MKQKTQNDIQRHSRKWCTRFESNYLRNTNYRNTDTWREGWEGQRSNSKCGSTRGFLHFSLCLFLFGHVFSSYDVAYVQWVRSEQQIYMRGVGYITDRKLGPPKGQTHRSRHQSRQAFACEWHRRQKHMSKSMGKTKCNQQHPTQRQYHTSWRTRSYVHEGSQGKHSTGNSEWMKEQISIRRNV